MDEFMNAEFESLSSSTILLTSLPSLENEFLESIVPSPSQYSHITTGISSPVPKRTKRELDLYDDNIGEWESFVDANMCYVVDSQHQPLCGSFGIGPIRIETSVRKEGDVWVLHKQNKFNIHTSVKGSLLSFLKPGCAPLFILKQDSTMMQIEKLAFTVHALKQYGTFLTEERAVLHQPPDKSPAPNMVISDQAGFVTWPKLQFATSTANNSQRSSKSSQQFYRIVINLVAYVSGSDSPCILLSKISPCFIVRGQNPGRIAKSKAKQEASLQQDVFSIPPVQSPSPVNNILVTHDVNSFENISTNTNFENIGTNVNNAWNFSTHDATAICRFGNVGVNVAMPTEAVSVGGNILVTGDIVKPSDKRIKKNFEPIDTAASRKNIENLRLYDYDRVDLASQDQLKYVRERGVIAQELQQTIPTAVRVAGDVKLGDGSTIPNLLVVNDRLLLLETIGATQEIGQALTRESENRTKLRSRFEVMVDYILMEEEKDKYGGSMKNQCFYFSLWSMGPAWSLFMAGFFFPIFWLFGSNYICSRHYYRRRGGYANFAASIITTGVIIILVYVGTQNYHPFNFIIPLVIYLPCYFGMGIITCGIVACARGRTLSQVEKKKKHMQQTLRSQECAANV